MGFEFAVRSLTPADSCVSCPVASPQRPLLRADSDAKLMLSLGLGIRVERAPHLAAPASHKISTSPPLEKLPA